MINKIKKQIPNVKFKTFTEEIMKNKEIHLVGKLALKAMEFDKEFNQILTVAERLDRYYIPTRYPDAFAFPVVPSETYHIEDAEQAIKEANLNLVNAESVKGADINQSKNEFN